MSQWDDYKDRATERRKTTENDAGSIQRQLAQVEAELAQEESLTQALELVEESKNGHGRARST